jgi:predicted aminopeptidase
VNIRCSLYPYLPYAAAMILLALVCALCSGCYTLTQGAAMLGYLGRAIPLERLEERGADPAPGAVTAGGGRGAGDSADAADTGTGDRTGEAAKTRRFVERVRDIRRFAMEDLGFKESANYTTYVELDRSYLAAVVSAAEADSFTRYEWRFPVVGRMPYKGFFRTEDAQKEREKLRKKGLDVWIRGVDGFSTLGWFKDPLYSYMRDYPDYRLANLLIHELFHATVYLKNQSQFNEELAEFVGTEGARIYIEQRYGGESPEYRQSGDSEADNAAYTAYLRGLIAELEELYSRDIPREEKLTQKAEIIARSQERFDRDYDTLFKSDNYRGFSSLPVNNAYLDLYRLYYEGNNFYRDLYEKSGRDLPRYIAAAQTLTKRERNPKEALATAVMTTVTETRNP